MGNTFEYAIPFPPVSDHAFTFIDLFAGIGGFRLAAQRLDGRCVFSSEWDEQAVKTYVANYGETPHGDITCESVKKHIPEHFDLLLAGFPCQAFSIAGRRRGFEETRGTLFFEVAEILRRHAPRAFVLENVKGLLSHARGRTLKIMLRVLREELGYYVPPPHVLNACNFGVPQHRERVFIVGFRADQQVNSFNYPQGNGPQTCFADIMEEDVVSAKYYLSTQYLHTLREHKRRHEQKGNGFGYEIIAKEGLTNALVCGGMGRERNLVIDDRLTDFTPVSRIVGEVNREGIRRMTPREWARLQGYPDSFRIVVADASAYKQFGNSVPVPVVESVMRSVLDALHNPTLNYEM